jgi:RNA polymerase sigma-70 factor, ECF subfamily
MRDSLERIYDEHAQALHGFLLNLTRDEALARDVLQEIFVRLARNPSLLDQARNERAFLLRLARNAAVDLIRRRDSRQRHENRFASEEPILFAPSADPDEQEFRLRLSEALGLLPPDQREVVHLKLWEEYTFHEIAEALEIPLDTAASRYRYALNKLREHLRPFYEEIR